MGSRVNDIGKTPKKQWFLRRGLRRIAWKFISMCNPRDVYKRQHLLVLCERRVAIGVVAELYGRVGTTDRPEIKRCVDSCSASAFRFGKFATVVSESDLPDFDNAFGKYIE